MSSEEFAIEVNNLSKKYDIYKSPKDRLKQLILNYFFRALNKLTKKIRKSVVLNHFTYSREFWALRDVSFSIKKGETFGVIGRNGSGKSTLLQIIAGTLTPTIGNVLINGNGRIAALLELGSGFNPEFTGRENVLLNGQILGLSKEEVESRYDRIVEFADIGDFIDQPVKTYSSGMFVRLAFAVQAHIDASIIIIDEALAVGDVFFRQKCYARLEELKKSGAAIILVSHSMTDIEQFCSRALLIDKGMAKYLGPSSQAAQHYYMLNQELNHETQFKEFHDLHEAHDNKVDISNFPALSSVNIEKQVCNGQAIFLGFKLHNAQQLESNTFQQGQTARFYYAFQLHDYIETPVCGIVIKSDKGVIVHGKNSWQLNKDVPVKLKPGTIVKCEQEITFDLAPGEYTFDIGFASVSYDTWLNRENISDLELHVRATRVCVITDAGSFSVGHAIKNNTPFLTHHGLTNLKGDIILTVNIALD